MLNNLLSKLAAEQPIDPAAAPQTEEMYEAAETPQMEAAEHAPGGYEEGGEGSDQLAQIEQMIAQLSPEELQQLVQELTAQEGSGDETAGLAQTIEGHLAETPEASVPEAPAEKQAALSMVKSASYIQGFIKHAIAQGADVSEAVDLYDSALTHAIHDLKVAALHGNQTKLDVDKDGKIKASDLAKLRASGKSKEKKAYYDGLLERAMEYGLSEKQAQEIIKQANPDRRRLSANNYGTSLQPKGTRTGRYATPEPSAPEPSELEPSAPEASTPTFPLGSLNPMLDSQGGFGVLDNALDDGKVRGLQDILAMKGDQSNAINDIASRSPLGSSATGEEPTGWLDNAAKLNIGAGEAGGGMQLSEEQVNSATPGVGDYLQAAIRNLKGKAQDLPGQGKEMLQEALAKGKDYASSAGESARDFLQSQNVDPSTALALGGGALAGAGGYGLYHYLKNKLNNKKAPQQMSEDTEPKTAAYYDGLFERAAEYGLSQDETIKLAGWWDTIKDKASNMLPPRQNIPGTPGGPSITPARLPKDLPMGGIAKSK
jgi:hypothetical protein